MSRSTEYPEFPVVGVGGVVLLEGRAVLIRRGNEPRQGEWSIPGGKLELGETLAEGVRRELREETGLDVEVGELIEAFDRVFQDAQGRTRFHYVILDFFCRVRSPRSMDGPEARSETGPVAGGDALELALVGEDEFERYGLNDAVRRVLQKAFAMSRPAS